MLVSEANSVGAELFFYVNNFFCSNTFTQLLAESLKTLYTHIVISYIVEHKQTTTVTTTTRTPPNQDNVNSRTELLCPSFDYIWVWVTICSPGGVWVLGRRYWFRFLYSSCKLINSIQFGFEPLFYSQKPPLDWLCAR